MAKMSAGEALERIAKFVDGNMHRIPQPYNPHDDLEFIESELREKDACLGEIRGWAESRKYMLDPVGTKRVIKQILTKHNQD